MTERALARVDVGAVERNAAHLAGLLHGDTALCVVVKADGYGHGALECARAALAGGAQWLAVATAAEAEHLRGKGVQGRLLVMGALTSEDLLTALAARADVVAWDPRFVELAAGLAQAPARVHVKLDTGMGRFGVRDAGQAQALAHAVASNRRLELAGCMTHFATADEIGDEYFAAQLQAFEPFARELKERYPDIVVHAANSPATYRDSASHFDMVRCGVAVYGLDPFQEDPAARGLEPALALESWVAAVRRFEPGDSAGYGRRWNAAEATWVATIPIGYGDGWRRGHTNNGDVLIGGRRHPVVGTVSMDNITVDLGPDTDVRIGDQAVLIGPQGHEQILAEEVAARVDTINYEITCGLTQRVRRVHVRT